MNPLVIFFHWPDGGVWSNILASILWSTPSFVLGLTVSHLKLKKHITSHHDDLSAKISLMHKHVKEIHHHLGVDKLDNDANN